METHVNNFLSRFNEQTTLTPAKTKKSSVSKPEPFTGKSTEVRLFIANFKNWAAEQKDLGDRKQNIWSALSFLQGEAVIWAAPFTEKAMRVDLEEGKAAGVVYPFNGDFAEFEKRFKARFGSLNEQADARTQIENFIQGKQTVAKYVQKFQDLADRTGYSDADLQARFKKGLNFDIRMALAPLEYVSGKPKTLDDLTERATNMDVIMHQKQGKKSDGSVVPSAPDPYAMDIDATRTNTGNRKTREEFLRLMRNRCFCCEDAV
jgi:hypothetical protein